MYIYCNWIIETDRVQLVRHHDNKGRRGSVHRVRLSVHSHESSSSSCSAGSHCNINMTNVEKSWSRSYRARAQVAHIYSLRPACCVRVCCMNGFVYYHNLKKGRVFVRFQAPCADGRHGKLSAQGTASSSPSSESCNRTLDEARASLSIPQPETSRSIRQAFEFDRSSEHNVRRLQVACPVKRTRVVSE